MPPKKYYKKSYKSKRSLNKRIYSSLVSKIPNTWSFKRSYTVFDFAATSVQQIGYSIKFQNLPNYAEFKALFEQYQIQKIKLQFFYTQSAITDNTRSTGYFYFLKDPNDSNNPANINELLENSSVKVCRMTDLNGNYFTQTLYPKVSMEIYKSAITTAYATLKENPFIDLSNDDGATPHFGFKIGCDQLATGGYLRCIGTLYFKCRQIK